MTSRSPFVPIIPAGGSGTRLWPLSRRHHPKFLLDLTGSGRSLLQATVDRLAPLGDRAPIVVTGVAHEEAVRAQLGRGVRVLAEPTPRNSMAAIAWAAAVAMQDDPEAIVGSFAADHVISPEDQFAEVVERARAAAELDYLVTIGITPTFAATGFGYIERAEGGTPGGAAPSSSDLEGTGAVSVARFVEKPDQQRAEEFLATRRFMWNAGMFVVKARVLLEALDRLMPAISAGARALAEADASSATPDPAIWESMPAIAIDHALAEPLAAEGRVASVPASFSWDDVGDFQALAEQLRVERAQEKADASPSDEQSLTRTVRTHESDVVVLGSAEVLAYGSTASVYSSSERRIALVGLDGVSVVETDDVLLVVSDARSQDLSAFVKTLVDAGAGDLA